MPSKIAARVGSPPRRASSSTIRARPGNNERCVMTEKFSAKVAASFQPLGTLRETPRRLRTLPVPRCPAPARQLPET